MHDFKVAGKLIVTLPDNIFRRIRLIKLANANSICFKDDEKGFMLLP